MNNEWIKNDDGAWSKTIDGTEYTVEYWHQSYWLHKVAKPAYKQLVGSYPTRAEAKNAINFKVPLTTQA